MAGFQAGRLARWLGLMPLIAGCAACSGIGATADLLGDRMQVQLRHDIAAGRVTLEQLPDGTRVTLVEPTLFARDRGELDDKGRTVLTNVIQALLNPALLQIEVGQSAAPPPGLQAQRVEAVTKYFKAARLGPALQSAGPPPAAAQGLTITVRITSS